MVPQYQSSSRCRGLVLVVLGYYSSEFSTLMRFVGNLIREALVQLPCG